MDTKNQKNYMGYDLDNPKQYEELLDEIKNRILNKKMMPQEALELPKDLLENIYAMAYELLNKGLTQQAKDIFSFLVGLNFKEFKYIYGYAACNHQLKDYSEAFRAYNIAMAFEPQNPLPYFFCADCLVNFGQPLLGVHSLLACMRLAEGRKEYKDYYDKAALLAEKISDTLPS